MKLGIDFGTTHTVVSIADQGNYPVVQFQTPQGDWSDHFPSLVALSKDQVRYGFEAQAVAEDPDWILLRSLKSHLKNVSQLAVITLWGNDYPIKKLMIDFFAALFQALANQSSLQDHRGPLFASLAVPANTQNTQRFLTAEAAVGGGFDLVNLFNEPSAVTVEYAKNYFKNIERSRKQYLLVYDLGGGTFDCSIAQLHDQYHQIIATDGIEDLGGDQFDQALAQLVLDQLKLKTALNDQESVRLLELCREKKEALTAQSKTILMEVNLGESKTDRLVRIEVKDYHQAVEPLIEQTLTVVLRLLNKLDLPGKLNDFTALYLVGGMSNFPLVARRLREQFGQNKVKKSHYCQSTVALGLAILEGPEPLGLKESLTRTFGLWREAQQGTALEFDTLFEKNCPLPAKDEPELWLRRRYRPTHNIGLFRFQECSALDKGQPKGLVTVYQQIRFPFEAPLQGCDLTVAEITRYPEPLDFEVEEIYSLNHRGEIRFKIISHQNGFTQTFDLLPMSGTL